MAALGGEADVDELHAVGLFGELLEVFGLLGVVDELVVVADVVTELLLGGGDVAAGGSGGLGQGGKNGQKRQRGQRQIEMAQLHEQQLLVDGLWLL